MRTENFLDENCLLSCIFILSVSFASHFLRLVSVVLAPEFMSTSYAHLPTCILFCIIHFLLYGFNVPSGLSPFISNNNTVNNHHRIPDKI